jgi:hypothetical protein
MKNGTRQRAEWQSPRLTVLAIQSDTKLGGLPTGYDYLFDNDSDS